MFNAYDLDGDGVISADEWMLGEVTQPLPLMHQPAHFTVIRLPRERMLK